MGVNVNVNVNGILNTSNFRDLCFLVLPKTTTEILISHPHERNKAQTDLNLDKKNDD